MFVKLGSMAVLDDINSVEEAAAWVRSERMRRGWTAKEAAARISEVASNAGDDLSLTQQAVSFFETGKAKSFPRWLRYFDLVVLGARVQDRVDLSNELKQPHPDNQYAGLSDDERNWLSILRDSSPEVRDAVLTLVGAFNQRDAMIRSLTRSSEALVPGEDKPAVEQTGSTGEPVNMWDKHTGTGFGKRRKPTRTGDRAGEGSTAADG